MGDFLAQRLEKLDKEIGDATANVEAAEDAWLRAKDPQQEAKLERAWEQAVQKEERLLEDRRALEAKLPGPWDQEIKKLQEAMARQEEEMARQEEEMARQGEEMARQGEEMAQMKLNQDLVGALRRKVFHYTESNISKGSNRRLRQRLKRAYGGAEKPGLQRCMLTGEYLPSTTVIASHLYKYEWRDLAEADIDLLDIDEPGNGLLLWKPLKHAFDTSALSFIYDKATDSFVARLLDPSLRAVRLCDHGAKLMGVQWVQPPPSSSRAAQLTFADMDGTALLFPPGCFQRPLKRVLCYQAHLAKDHAAKVGWLQLAFDDFWSEGEPYVDKVKAWLDISG